MTIFITLAVLLVLAALVVLAWPLLAHKRGTEGSPDAVASNAAIYREQLAELEAERTAGTISQSQWEQAHSEVERRAIEEASVTGAATQARSPATAIALAIALPLAAAGLYLVLGNPDGLDPQMASPASSGGAHATNADGMAGLLEKLADRLKEHPDDVEGWMLLGRSRARLQQFPEAAAAYSRAVKLQPGNAQLLADYADVVAMTQGRKLEGEPARLVARALAIDPENIKALSISGTIAFDRRDFNGAIRQWKRTLALAPPESPFAQSVRDSIAEAEAQLGTPKNTAASTPSAPAAAASAASAVLSGRISLAAGTKAAPEDTVFVFARPADGRRMPVAILRRQARDLPFDFTLDDSMAMNPAVKLSDFAQVVVVARVSKTGQAAAGPGDIEAASAAIAPGTRNIKLEIGAPARP